MKAPLSKRARRIFSNDKAAQKVIQAARKGTSTTVKVGGNTYVVQKASQTRSGDPPTQARENSSSDE